MQGLSYLLIAYIRLAQFLDIGSRAGRQELINRFLAVPNFILVRSHLWPHVQDR